MLLIDRLGFGDRLFSSCLPGWYDICIICLYNVIIMYIYIYICICMYIVLHSFHEAMVHGDQGAWKPVPLTGAVPSHRQSLALCGAPGRIPGASSGHGGVPQCAAWVSINWVLEYKSMVI